MSLEISANRLLTNFEKIEPQNLLATLQFSNWSQVTNRPNFVESLLQSHWYQSKCNRMFLEIIHPDTFDKQIIKTIRSSDFDDTYNFTSQQHQDRLARPSQAGINISPQTAHDIYKLSMLSPNSDSEPCYTPQMDLSLLSFYLMLLKKQQSPTQAWNNLLAEQQRLQSLYQQIGNNFLPQLTYDQDILNLMIDRSTTKYLYRDFIAEFFSNKQPDSTNILVTRGFPEGALGQIDKVRTNGGIDPRLNLILYTRDLKASAFQTVFKIFPEATSLVHYDDNPTEIDSLMNTKWDQHITFIRVRNGKRKDLDTKTPPTYFQNDQEFYQPLAA